MTIRAVALPLLLLVPVLAGCGDDEAEQVTLEVTTQDWTGWSEQQPAADRRVVTLSEGATFTVDLVGGEVTVTVAAVDDDEIELRTSRELAPDGDEGGVDLNDLDDEFALERGGSVRFSTPSLDGGTRVTVAEQ